MQTEHVRIPIREALHYMGWRGTPIEPQMLAQIQSLIDRAEEALAPRTVMRRFVLEEDRTLRGTAMLPAGRDVARMLEGCHEAVLLAATLGVQSERMLLKMQAKSSVEAVLLDAVLSAAIEAVCDAQESALRNRLAAEGLYLTDRFSPGYGDMPMEQTRSICAVLEADKRIGLTVSDRGIMIPRKSVTAIMGISRMPVSRRASGCAMCSMRETCMLKNGNL